MNYLDYFNEICKIPHGSGNTKMISDYLVKFAKDNGLTYYQDKANNVIIVREASKGREADEPVIIQGHMDMVAVHDDDYAIDMEKEGLNVKTDGDFLYAEGTSLGGDDGIAVAYALQLLSDKSLVLPGIEAVITVDEEVGMLGADVIDLSVLKGHTMLNIDSEEEGVFLVSCAGGARIDFKYPMNKVEAGDGKAYKILIEGFKGGHSGTEIDKGRANAIEVMGTILKKLNEANLVVGYADIKGGTADNAICNACEAVIYSREIEPALFDIIKIEAMESYASVETDYKITLTEVDAAGKEWFYNNETYLWHFLTSLPNGVIKMSADIEGLVQTSLNKGIITMENGNVNLSISVRSSVDSEKDDLLDTLKRIAKEHGAETSVRGDYPGWAFRKESPIRDKMVKTYEEMYGKEAEVQALHAGLECGIFAKKIKDLDCVSFGPNIYDIHTTKEKLSLSSAERTWEFILKVLE